MANADSQTSLAGSDRFEGDLVRVVSRVRGAFASVLEEVGGLSPHVKDVCDALGVHRNLGWQLSKVACEPDPFTVARFVPATGAMKTFLKAAASRSASAASIHAANDAVSDFENFVIEHAENRESLEAMLARSSTGIDEGSCVAQRKAAFHGNAATHGVQAKVQLRATIAYPGDASGLCDLVRLSGFMGFRRNRGSARWFVGRTLCDDGQGGQRKEQLDAIDPAVQAEDGTPAVPLVRQFCSTPLPMFRRHVAADGFIYDELGEGAVGNTAAMTFVTAEVSRKLVPLVKTEEFEHGNYLAQLWTPVETLVFDIFLHNSLVPKSAGSWEAKLFNTLGAPSRWREGAELPLFEKIEHFSTALGGAVTPEIPRYPELIRYTLGQMGWNPAEFSLHRLRIKFPPIGADVMISHLLVTEQEQAASKAALS